VTAMLNTSHLVRKCDRLGNRRDDHIPSSINARIRRGSRALAAISQAMTCNEYTRVHKRLL